MHAGCDKVTGRERNLQGSSSSDRAALGAQYVPSGITRMCLGWDKFTGRKKNLQGSSSP